MYESNESQRARAKLGPLVEDGDLTVTGTPDTLTGLPDGHYTIEPTVDTYVLQCTTAALADATATDGVICPANVETEFNVDGGDGNLKFVRVSSSGTARVHRRDRSKGAE